MAKRGESRPWRLAFTWDNGIGGTNTFHSEADALDAATRMQADAALQDRTLTTTVTHREAARR